MEFEKPFWETGIHPILGFTFTGVNKMICTKRQKQKQREKYALEKLGK